MMAGAASSYFAYDVFLSFRGEDTRFGFTGNLYKALHDRGIRTFIDDVGLQRGDSITPSLTSAIENSRTAIIVFSKNYASSSFCLDELVNIIACIKEKGRLALPVFYDVDPSDVRHQRGSYQEALALHEERFKDDDMEKLQNWRMALFQAANLSGFHFKLGDEYEYVFIDRIIKEVSIKINHAPLHVADYPVGLESRVQDVIKLLDVSSPGVHMVGIHGIGGIGKTTLARAVYNLIADRFDGACFLENVRENSNKHGLKYLQEMLLSKLVGEKDITFTGVNEGISIIKQRLDWKMVLLILDDVDKQKQLCNMVGGPDWFGAGSRVIITTRDKHLLALHEVEKIYEVDGLIEKDALELFRRNAFKNYEVDSSYDNILIRAITYASGLPLALEVIGSRLSQKSIEEWESALDQYKKIPLEDIHQILRVSYDSLEENEKGIFLDIACFFNTYDMAYVKRMLVTHGFHAEDGIRVLADKSLIKINGSGCMRMHDLIQDMGREIVRQESTLEPGRRSRLWIDKDIVHVLEENTGTDKIEVIMLKARNKKEVKWSGKAFKKMKNLRILIIEEAIFSTGAQHLPNSLRVLDWSYYPSQFLPSDFSPKELEILNMSNSCLKFLQPLKRFETLLSIKLGGCKFLTELPSLCEVPFLMNLTLDKCTNLVKVHDSVGFLDNLHSLSVTRCTRLETLVPCIKLASLEYLNLGWCSRLRSFPEVLEKMDKIRKICLDGTGIDKLPFSIGNLVGLENLYMRLCKRLNQVPSSIHMLPKVEVLTDFAYARGFQIFEGYQDEVKVRSEVSPSTMVVYNEGSFADIDVCSLYKSPHNIIQVCRPNPHEHPNLEFLFKVLKAGGVDRYKRGSRNSSMHFSFRKKFPKIALCCSGEAYFNRYKWMLNFKFSVLINGTEQLSSSTTLLKHGTKYYGVIYNANWMWYFQSKNGMKLRFYVR